MTNPRQTTENIIELAEEGMIEKGILITNLLNWLSETEVVEFANYNDYLETTENPGMNPRFFTEKMIEIVEEGMFSEDLLIRDLLNWQSEDDVEEFAVANEYL